MRSHLGRRPIAQSAVVHGKTIVMFCHRYYVLCTRFFEQVGPCRRIEVLGLEHGDEIFVPELVQWSVRSDRSGARPERALVNNGIDFLQQSCSLGVVLAASLLPNLINLRGIFGRSGSRGALSMRDGTRERKQHNTAQPTSQ